jgi:uncharacterized RDD family membrane protein YckC
MARASAAPTSGSALDNRRVLAALIDIAIISVGYFVILGVAGRSPAGKIDALYAVCIGWALYYYFAMESGNGQTLGKRAMKIRVVDMDGQPAGMRAIGLRTVLRVIDGLAAYLVGLIVMLVTGERRGRLGDLVGKTMIVSADEPAAAPDMSAPEMPAAVSRVPIAESGPAFAEAEAEPAGESESVEESEPEVASPALVELASDVSAVTDDPEREVEPDPEPEIEELPPAATLEAEAAAKAASAEDSSETEAASEPEPKPRMEELPSAEMEELPSAETEELPSAETEETDVDEDETDEVEPDDEDLEVEEDEVEELEAEAEEEEEVTVKSVETVSAIDLVMEDEQAVAGSQGKGRRS